MTDDWVLRKLGLKSRTEMTELDLWFERNMELYSCCICHEIHAKMARINHKTYCLVCAATEPL